MKIYIVYALDYSMDMFPVVHMKIFTDRQQAWDYEEHLMENHKSGPTVYTEREADEWKLPLQ